MKKYINQNNYRMFFVCFFIGFNDFEKVLNTFLKFSRIFVKFRQDRSPDVFSTAPDPQNNPKNRFFPIFKNYDFHFLQKDHVFYYLYQK